MECTTPILHSLHIDSTFGYHHKSDLSPNWKFQEVAYKNYAKDKLELEKIKRTISIGGSKKWYCENLQHEQNNNNIDYILNEVSKAFEATRDKHLVNKCDKEIILKCMDEFKKW